MTNNRRILLIAGIGALAAGISGTVKATPIRMQNWDADPRSVSLQPSFGSFDPAFRDQGFPSWMRLRFDAPQLISTVAADPSTATSVPNGVATATLVAGAFGALLCCSADLPPDRFAKTAYREISTHQTQK